MLDHGPKIVSTATSANAKPITAAIFNATRRFFTNERLSLRLYAMLSASMYAFIAPVTDQTASTKPTIVSRRLDAGFASARFSESPSSCVACDGTTPCRCCIRFAIVVRAGDQREEAGGDDRTDGIAKNEL